MVYLTFDCPKARASQAPQVPTNKRSMNNKTRAKHSFRVSVLHPRIAGGTRVLSLIALGVRPVCPLGVVSAATSGCCNCCTGRGPMENRPRLSIILLPQASRASCKLNKKPLNKIISPEQNSFYGIYSGLLMDCHCTQALGCWDVAVPQKCSRIATPPDPANRGEDGCGANEILSAAGNRCNQVEDRGTEV